MTAAEYRAAALAAYTGSGGTFSDGDIDIDEDAIVSESDEGAYIAAWVWVPNPEAEDALPVYVGRVDCTTESEKFATLAEGEARIAEIALDDPEGVERGDYYIDVTEDEEDRLAEVVECGHTIVMPRADVSAFMAAVAALEEYADGLAGLGDRALDTETDEAVTTLSRLASDIDQQVSAQ